MLNLIDITNDNFPNYKIFEKRYDNLSKYLSRIYPESDKVIKWCFINVDDKNIGSIWLEAVNENTVRLGIFIIEEKYRNNGFGTNSIKQILSYAKYKGYKSVILNVRTSNIRAYRLYQKLEFVEIKRYKKENGIEVFLMKLEL